MFEFFQNRTKEVGRKAGRQAGRVLLCDIIGNKEEHMQATSTIYENSFKNYKTTPLLCRCGGTAQLGLGIS